MNALLILAPMLVVASLALIIIKRLLTNYQMELQKMERVYQSQRNDLVEQLVAGVVHKFRNDLSAVKGYMDVLESTANDSVKSKSIEHIDHLIEQSAIAMTELATSYAPSKVELSSLDIDEYINSTLDSKKHTIGLGINISFTHRANARVEADISKLEHYLLKILVNAKDAANSNGTIIIQTTRVKRRWHRDWVQLSVTDTGEQPSDSDRLRVSEPFFTTNPSNQDGVIGLAPIFYYMQTIGGSAFVQSAPQRGTTITLQFACAD